MKHYRFYTNKTKNRKTWYARAQVFARLRLELAKHLGLQLRNRIFTQAPDGSQIESPDCCGQMLGRDGVYCYYSWGYPHLATDCPEAIAFIEERLPTWSRVLKRPSKHLSRRLAARDYENYYFGD